MSPLPARVLATIREHQLAGADDRIAVGLSGGADSVALVWILRQLETERLLGASIAGLIHVNHGLRGEEARRDEAFCRALAGRLGLPIDITQVDVAAIARDTGRSIEAAGRDARYSAFRDASTRLGATVVATGHTADDQAETVMLRLLRGAGARGAGGIRVRRGAVIRPLIHARRAELRAYLAERRELFCEDSSNADRSFPRNLVRHELMPVIARISPGGPAALARFAELSVADETYLQGVATEAAASIVSSRRGGDLDGNGVQLNAAALAELPPAIGRRVVRLAMEQVAPGLGCSLKHVQAVLDLARSGGTGHLDLTRLQVDRRNEWLWLNRRPAGPVTRFDCPLMVPGIVEVPEAGMTIRASLLGALGTAALGSGRGDRATVQAGPENGPWTVRNRHPGDRLWPLGAPGHRKLHDLFIDRKVPRQARDRVPIVVDASGQIVWVVGLTIAHGYRVTVPGRGVVVLEAWRKPE